MDTTARIHLGIAAVAVVAAFVGFYFLSKRGPRGAVLIAAAVLYVVGTSIRPGASRDLHLVAGVLRLTGFVGGILGVFDLLRPRRSVSRGEDFVVPEIVSEREEDKSSSPPGDSEQSG